MAMLRPREGEGRDKFRGDLDFPEVPFVGIDLETRQLAVEPGADVAEEVVIFGIGRIALGLEGPRTATVRPPLPR